MAGNEGSGQTDLLTGWSCVVHRPSEDPEPSELPSTVDMAAFSSGITVEPTPTSNNVHSCESDSESDSDSNNSGTDISGSCSQSDSSDSETSSSSQGSSTRSSSPEFSVTSSQTNGLRLKIATVRKSCTSPVDKQKTTSDIKVCDKSALESPIKSVTKSCNLSSSSESHCSKSTSDSSSESDTPSINCKSDIITENKNDKSTSVKKPVAKVRLKDVDTKKIDKKPRSVTVNSPKSVLKSKTRPKRTRKMASLPMSRCSSGSSSDSEDGSESDRTMLASCSLQEIRQEDLAAILPDQQECDAFGDFDCGADKNSPHTGDGSGSDMELPQQAVNALIQRTTESSSESESRLPLNPNTLYSNSLLQQFVAQTQMLNAPSSGASNPVDPNISTPLQISTDNTNAPVETENAKRKRGRPKKSSSHKLQDENKPSRSGSSSKSILNIEYCGNPNVSPDSGIQNSSDHVSSPEPSPNPNIKPKFNKNETCSTSKHTSKNSIESKNSSNSKAINCKLNSNKLKDQSKLSLTSNSFDRVLYGNTDRVLYPPRRKAGRPPITRKGPGRPPKHKPINTTCSEGKSSDSCKIIENSVNISNIAKVSDKLETKSNKHKKNLKNNCDISVANLEKKDLNKKLKSTSSHEACDKTGKRIDVNNKIVQKCESKQDGNDKNATAIKTSKKSASNRVVLANKNKTDILKAKYTTLKNSKVMHSRHKDKKHKKCKFKILKPISAAIFDPKLNTEIEKLVSDFGKYCNISLIKQSKENVPEMLKVAKKSSKKRKASDYSERKKKKQNVSNSFNKETNSNEQRLPLKKRHYHVSTNESASVPSQPDTEIEGKSKINNSAKDNKNTLIIAEHFSDTKALTDVPQPKKLTNDDLTENYESVGIHINEAIEACITKYSSPLQNSSKTNHENITSQLGSAPINKEKINSSNSSIAATTPKKRHRLEAKNNYEESLTVNDIIQNRATVVLEEQKLLDIKTSDLENSIKKQSASPKPIEITQKKIPEKKNESVAQIITRKKNRLEDLTLTLASKVNSTSPIESVPEVHLRRKKDIIKLEESYQNSQKLKKDETAIDSTTVPKMILKVEEDVIDSQKRKRDSKKVHDTERNQKYKKDILKSDLHDSKRKKDASKESSKDVSGSNLKVIKKDEDLKTDDSIAENNAKRKKDIAKLEESTSRASVIKSPISKRIKPTEPDKLDSITTDVPTGIFMPTIDIELHIPSSTIPNSHALQKSSFAFLEKVITPELPEINKSEKGAPLSKQKDSPEGVSRKKVRKRRAINRTGFPTIKKKKKKVVVAEPIPQVNVEEKIVCDRVPQEGEKYSTFLQRTEKLNVSNTILEKLQNCINSPSHNRDDQIPKYNSDTEEESMYELGISKNGRPISRQSLKNSRSKDVSPDGSTTDKNLRSFNGDDKDSNTDLDDLSLEARLDLIKTNKEVAQVECKWRSRHSRHVIKTEKSLLKQNLRDFSPASSVDTFNEKKGAEEVAGSGDEKRVRKLPRWRKKFLIAGLFSDYYKEDDEVIRAKRTEAASKSSKIIYNSSEHPYGLLPPPYHCGRYLRCRKIPFQLPHDLWWQHTHSQLPGRDIVPSWNYRKIRSNVYNVKVTGGACEPQSCNCSPTKGCDDDCINRLVLAECPATHKCQNQKIQKHEWSPGIERFMTISKGWGIRTKLPIKQHEFILEYVGEVVSDQEFKERMATRYAHDTHHYCLHLDGGLVIDGHRMGGDGRFVNHSCEPNCEMQKWSVNGQFRMALFALRNIQDGEELTYDYNFSLFNPAEGQECKCGSENCRGVIGGKSQRVRQSIASSNSGNSNQVGRVGRPRKNQAKRTTSSPKEPPAAPAPPPVAPVPLMKPMNNAQKMFVREHHCFIIRNLNRTKYNRDKSMDPMSVDRANAATPTTDHNDATTFINHLNALRQPRNMKTRRLAQAEDNPELKKVAQLASILRDLYTIVTTAKDEKEEFLCASFMTLPSKRKVPEYYQRITEPLDFATIEQNISMGVYRTVEYFDKDMNKIFTNTVRFFGRTSEIGIASARLKKIYGDAKQQSLSKLEEVIGEKLPSKFISSKRKGDEEDVIRCICGMFRDEGLMIQCERCLVWQHCECVQADVAAASYHCERCVAREVDYEIPLDEYTEHGHRYYMTLMRGDLQLRQGDTVYVLRDIPIPGTNNKKHTYKTIGKIKYTDLDIFRIERLWKDCNSGQRFAYGHHYLRPHETFHEPTRKFFPNEVMRVPLYEAVPVELVISHCWVFDINTYCKGRPIGAPEDHIYICEYRVDKSARLFSKISKAKYPICTKSYAFDRFDVRLKLSRTYTPHDLDPAFVKPRGRKPQDNEDVKEMPQLPVHVPVIRTLSEKKIRLNKILLILLNKIPAKQALDVSYLLEGGRRRKKQLEK